MDLQQVFSLIFHPKIGQIRIFLLQSIYIYIRQVNDYPVSFVLLFSSCKFNNKHNGKTKEAFDVKTTGPFDVYPCLFTF